MRTPELSRAIETVGGVKALARLLGLSQPAVSMWTRVPANRVIEVEAATGISREELRPDLFATPSMENSDPIAAARADEYSLLAMLLWRAPDAVTLKKLALLNGDATPIGMAHLSLSLAAAAADPDKLQREFFDLFIGLGRGELLPYASYYLTGFLHERPLANVRADLLKIGVERDSRVEEPEDHIAVLCETMSGLIRGDFGSQNTVDDSHFFERHLARWARRFFTDLEAAAAADFYRPVGALGRVFMEIEAEAFALPA